MRIKAQKNENLSKRILHRPFVPEPIGTSLVFGSTAGADQWRSTSPEKRIRTASPRSRKLRGFTGWERTALNRNPLWTFPALQTEYPDIKGWISIPGTCVDYPVLQSSADDPEYYLRRTYKGEWRTAGSIFFQWDCSAESQNTVVYGHNMNDGTMFAVLQKMTDEAFRNEHSKILLQTSNGLREYQIAAVLKTDTQSSGLTALNLRIMRISCLFRKSSSHSHYTNPNHPRRGLPPADARHLFYEWKTPARWSSPQK